MEALIERAESLAALAGMLDDVRARSTGRLVLVGGESGVGKTALLRRFCAAQSARERRDAPERQGVRVLWGACEPLRTPRPLGPLSDVAATTGGELEDLIAAGARPHEVAMALLGELRRPPPTVLVLEDVHWADEATLDVLTLIATRISAAPALVLASYRDDELDRAEQLRFVLGELVRRPGRLKIAPLSEAGVAELAAPHGVDGDELYRRTGGNPFFVVEVLAAGGDAMPDTVRDAVLARAARLSAPARRLLEAVATVPGQVESDLLETLASDVIEHVDECLASGMLAAGSAHVEFRHELARVAIEEATAPNRRVALHRAALTALTQQPGAESARLAHHAEAAQDADAVQQWAPRAAERAAAAGAHREAAAQYARALRFAERLSPAARAELLQRRANECYMTAEFEAAIAAQREALAIHREHGDVRREGDTLRSLSRLLFFAGRTDEAEPVVLQAVELLERLPPSHELAMAYGNVAQRRMVVEDDDAAEWGTRALTLARELDDTEAALYALINLGGVEFRADRPEGRDKLEQALQLAQEHGLHDYAGRAYSLLVQCAVRNRLFAVADEHLAPGLDYCSEHGLDTWRLYLIAAAARLQLARGNWEAATDAAAAALSDRRSPPVACGWALAALGLVRARRGDASADAPLDEAHALVHACGELMRIVPVAAARAECAWLRGDDDAVASLTDDALALARRRSAPWAVGELAYWRWQAGAVDGAEDAAGPYRLAIEGDAEGAAERWREIGCPYEAALALAESDDDQLVRDAIEELQRLGARPAARIVARRLRERGVRGVPRGPHPRTRENPAGLTARELEVLALVAEGLRNAQIAQRLVVSEKTVGHHVSAVLRKLDVSTRGEASAKALRLGLV
jgi:DNA-binding CsgD family transcriptional regulator/tetratricopeptide (TPR) repeat protein